MALVISMQGFGTLLSCIVALLAIKAELPLWYTWRLLLGFGALPALVAFLLRLGLHETKAFTASQDATASGHNGSLCDTVGKLRVVLLGTALSWFVMNLVLYSIASFKTTILHELGNNEGTDDEQLLSDTLFATVSSVFAIVGFLLGHAALDNVSRFSQQLWGFLGVALTFFTAVAAQSSGENKVWKSVAVLSFILLFMNAGPNMTTFILPGEAFPTRVRATCHGISAACGKMGAVIGTALLPHFKDMFGLSAVYCTCGIMACIGALVTFCFTPRRLSDNATLDESLDRALASMYGRNSPK